MITRVRKSIILTIFFSKKNKFWLFFTKKNLTCSTIWVSRPGTSRSPKSCPHKFVSSVKFRYPEIDQLIDYQLSITSSPSLLTSYVLNHLRHVSERVSLSSSKVSTCRTTKREMPAKIRCVYSLLFPTHVSEENAGICNRRFPGVVQDESLSWNIEKVTENSFDKIKKFQNDSKSNGGILSTRSELCEYSRIYTRKKYRKKITTRFINFYVIFRLSERPDFYAPFNATKCQHK